VTTGGDNTFVGVKSGNFTMGATATLAYQSSYNVGVGVITLEKNTKGYYNSAVGYAAMEANTTGYHNVALGTMALYKNTQGNENTAVGVYAMYENLTGINNTAIGYCALINNTDGYDNVAVGYYSLFTNTHGYYNIAIGREALYYNIDGHSNTAVGYQALQHNNHGLMNVALGDGTLIFNTSGWGNTAVGYAAIEDNSTGSYNTALGYFALHAFDTGYNNVAVGYNTMYGNPHAIGHDNVGVGANSLMSDYAGSNNSTLGSSALYTNTQGDYNCAVGDSALYLNATGDNNTAIGVGTLGHNTAGYENTALGLNALHSTRPTSKAITVFSDYSATVPGTVRAGSAAHGLPGGATANVRISGTDTFDGIYTVTRIDANYFYFTHAWTCNETYGWWSYDLEGRYNTGAGAYAGYSITTGQQNCFLGYYAGYHASQKVDAINSMALGYGAYTTADNQVVIGNTDITETLLYGLVGIETTPAAQLDVCQANIAGAIPCLELDQDDEDDVFINFVGATAADQTKSISIVNGDGVVTGPKNFSASAGWEYVGMLKIKVNGQAFWTPYYQPDVA
jgi:hypothetical protein